MYFQSFQSQSALDKHLICKAHLDRVAGLSKAPPSKSAVKVKAIRQQAIEDKLHYCNVCQKAFENDWSLQRHLKTRLHAKRAGIAGGDSTTATS